MKQHWAMGSLALATALLAGSGTAQAQAPAQEQPASETAEPACASLVRVAFPDATELAVVDRTGSGDHFQVTVTSRRFEGLTLVDQHRLVYDALAAPLSDGTIHELRIKTKGTA